jgi:1-acyl-sn-glycerol-3-phosphate acyltransferase
MRAMAGSTLLILRVLADARVDRRVRIEGGEGVLVISNHQSLLDIPVVVRSMSGKHPRIVTRARFARGIPLISHLLRITRAPLVEPRAPSAPQIAELNRVARTTTHPLLIFPEGHRSRDGALLPWRRGGLEAILAARPWTVHLVVVDGLFRAGRFQELVRALSGLRGTAISLGPFEWTDPRTTPSKFLDELEAHMGGALAALRAEGS